MTSKTNKITYHLSNFFTLAAQNNVAFDWKISRSVQYLTACHNHFQELLQQKLDTVISLPFFIFYMICSQLYECKSHQSLMRIRTFSSKNMDEQRAFILQLNPFYWEFSWIMFTSPFLIFMIFLISISYSHVYIEGITYKKYKIILVNSIYRVTMYWFTQHNA